jgi:hypothetical protein
MTDLDRLEKDARRPDYGGKYFKPSVVLALIAELRHLRTAEERKGTQMNRKEAESKRTYLGDGVYLAEYDYCLTIYTSDGVKTTNKIILEHDTEKSLFEILKRRQEPNGNQT